MANELRQYSAFQGGMLDAKIDTTAGGSFTFSSPAFANLPAIGSTQHLMISLDPFGLNGAPEEIKVTAHSAFATTITATGSQGFTVGRIHYQNEYWTATWEADDLTGVMGGPAKTLLAFNVLGSAVPTVTFSSIPSTYNHLELLAVMRGDNASEQNCTLQVNGDTGANYDRTFAAEDNSTPAFSTGVGGTSAFVSYVPGTGATANVPSTLQLFITMYAGTALKKAMHFQSGWADGAAANWRSEVGRIGWRSTAAINALALSIAAGNFIAGSGFYLYGVN